jgi:hypothetical protein
MFKRLITTNNEFILGALFGILISPLADFTWHILWNYALSWSANMNEPWLSIMKFSVLLVLAIIVLVIYYKTVLKPKRDEDKTEDVRTNRIISTINENTNLRNAELINAINNLAEAIRQNRGGQNEQPTNGKK